MNPTQLLDYLTAHPWAGWLALGALSLLVSKRSQVDAWAESNPRVAGVMKLLRGLGIDPWLVLQSLSLIVRGKLPAAKADVAPKTPKSGSLPPSGNPGAFALLLFASALALNQTACGGSIPPPKPGCDDQSAADIAALCFARVKTECVDRGIPEAECPVIKACDEEADNRVKECSR